MNLHARDLRWQSGTTRVARIRRLALTDDEGQRVQLEGRRDTVVVESPRDLMCLLEGDRKLISTVILAGQFAYDAELAALVHHAYPDLGIDRREAN